MLVLSSCLWSHTDKWGLCPAPAHSLAACCWAACMSSFRGHCSLRVQALVFSYLEHLPPGVHTTHTLTLLWVCDQLQLCGRAFFPYPFYLTLKRQIVLLHPCAPSTFILLKLTSPDMLGALFCLLQVGRDFCLTSFLPLLYEQWGLAHGNSHRTSEVPECTDSLVQWASADPIPSAQEGFCLLSTYKAAAIKVFSSKFEFLYLLPCLTSIPTHNSSLTLHITAAALQLDSGLFRANVSFLPLHHAELGGWRTVGPRYPHAGQSKRMVKPSRWLFKMEHCQVKQAYVKKSSSPQTRRPNESGCSFFTTFRPSRDKMGSFQGF